MKKIFFVLIVCVSALIISCSEINTPPVNEEGPPITQFGCFPTGVLLDFVDTCSYSFINEFIAQFDSVTVTESFLGATFNLYADSGSYQYWLNYFDSDPTVVRIDFYNPKPDSTVLSIKVSGEKSTEEETLRLSQIEHLTLLTTDVHQKTLFIEVPENSEERWKKYFEQFPFISYSTVIMICIC